MPDNIKRKYSNISILISTISIAITVFINFQIAERYLRAYGKTKALFGITELFQFGYQYYVAILGLISLVLAILSFRKEGKRKQVIVAALLSLISILIVFARIWRLYV